MAMVKNELNMLQVIKDYQSGMTLRAIADKHYSNRTTIREKLIDVGVYKIKTDKITKAALEQLLTKYTMDYIAKLYLISIRTLYRLIKKYRIKKGELYGTERKSKKSS